MSDFYNKYPYTDFHELNLDWVIERVKKLTEDWIETKQAWEDTEADWQELYNYVHDYFDNLNVQTEINNKINAMILDGTFQQIATPIIQAKVAADLPGVVSTQIGGAVSSQIGGAVASQLPGVVSNQIGAAVVDPVNDWLDDNITQPTTPVVDQSLSISGAAADAAVTGEVNASLTLTDESINILNNLYDSDDYLDGTVHHAQYGDITNPDYIDTNYVHIPVGVTEIYFRTYYTYVMNNTFYVNTWTRTKTGIWNKDLLTAGTADADLGGRCYKISLPANCVFVSIAIPKQGGSFSDPTMFSISPERPLNRSKVTFGKHVMYPLSTKIINCLGDSITSTDYVTPTWWQQIADEVHCSFRNYGVSGTPIKHTNNNDGFVDRYSAMNDTADAVIVMGGTNDTEQIGVWNSSSNGTFFGALNILIPGLLDKYPGKPIIFMTPIKLGWDSGTYYEDPRAALAALSSADIPTMQLKAEAIKAKCEQYGLICIDLYNNSGINGYDTNKVYYLPDQTHPTALGQERIKDFVKRELMTVFNSLSF